MTKITLEFDPTDEASLAAAQTAVLAFTGGTVTGRPTSTTTPVTEQPKEDTSAADKKAADAAAKKKADEKKAADAAARKKAEEEAAARKAAEEAEAAAATDDAGLDDEPTGDDAPTYSREDVRKALKDYSALEGKDAAIKILKDHGASSMSELKEEDFAKVMKAVG